jgi:hypothetical protein
VGDENGVDVGEEAEEGAEQLLVKGLAPARVEQHAHAAQLQQIARRRQTVAAAQRREANRHVLVAHFTREKREREEKKSFV